MDHILTFVYMQRRNLALGPRFGLVHGPQERLSWLPGVAIWTIFEFLGLLVIYSSYQVKPSTRINSYRRLCIYSGKDSSAWAEVWTVTYCSRASIMAHVAKM